MVAAGSWPAGARAPEALSLRRLTLDLPGPPSTVIGTDLNGDGRRDLVVVLAWGEWVEIGDDRTEGLVQFTEVVPALFDRREARAWLGTESGDYVALEKPLPLPTSVLTAEAGPPGVPVLALTDDGIAAIRLADDGRELSLVPLVHDPPVLARAETFLPRLGLVRDMDSDGIADVLHPAADGPAIYRGTPAGLSTTPIVRLHLPGDRREGGRRPKRHYPLPRAQDVNGDSRLDLVVGPIEGADEDDAGVWVLEGREGGRFGEPRPLELGALGIGSSTGTAAEGGSGKPDQEAGHVPKSSGGGRELGWFGDLDGDGRAEVVTVEELDRGKGGLAEAKRPLQRYRFHRVADFVPATEPYRTAEFEGHVFDVETDTVQVQAFQDLDGDGRRDLVTVSLDFSLMQVFKIMATKRMSVELDFNVHAQGADGVFRKVPDLDLKEKLVFDLKALTLGQFAQFSGDFDGDGRIDFVHLGRGRKVTVHRGGPGCTYPKAPDLAVELDEPIRDLAQVRIEDLNGDRRADIAIARPGPVDEPGVPPPVRLDLYLSEGQ